MKPDGTLDHPLELLIKSVVDGLPDLCKLGKLGYHEWQDVYNPYHKVDDPERESSWAQGVLLKDPSVREPWRVCKICFRRSNQD